MAGTSGQQNLRKAIGALKDTTMVGMAKVNSGFKELDVAVLKATNHVEVLPKEKHVRTILGAVSGSRPRVDVHYCIQALARRLAKTRSWTVALKTLIVIHRALREVDHSFCEELIGYNNSQGHMLNLLHFKDESSPSAWDNSTYIRTYALYLEECLECFRVLKYDFYRDHSRTKKFNTPDLLEKLPAMQQLLFRLLACQPVGSARYNFIVQYTLSIVATESVRLYVAITDGVLNMVDKFFEMQRRDAVRALEIYRRSGEQAERLSEFFEICRSLEFGRRQKYVKIEQPPASFLSAMEEYVKDAPQTLMLPWRPVFVVPEGTLETDPKQTTDTEEKSDQAADFQEPKTDKSDADAAPLIPDLMSWDEPCQELSESNENNSSSLSITAPDEFPIATIHSDVSNEPASWELALVTTENTSSASAAQIKGGVLDRSMLDSLYEVAMAQTNPNTAYRTAEVSSNPFEVGGYSQETFYPPSQANYMQMVEIPQQQQQVPVGHDYMQIDGIPSFVGQQLPQKEQPMDYMQIAGIPQKEVTSIEQHEQSLVAYDYTQNVGMPQPQAASLGQQDHLQEQPINMQEVGMPIQKEVVGHEPLNPFGNPFVEQDSLPSLPQNQSSSLSLPSVPQNQSSNLSLL
ncbi:hypothetical protein ACJIZ3_000685 [Penstemon smallii]|uniref:ENTH domain-containing protein n=1 Tax=Penstemon smallii TaxID=265156 RepID=A0ABD3RDZ4_9LAMI